MLRAAASRSSAPLRGATHDYPLLYSTASFEIAILIHLHYILLRYPPAKTFSVLRLELQWRTVLLTSSFRILGFDSQTLQYAIEFNSVGRWNSFLQSYWREGDTERLARAAAKLFERHMIVDIEWVEWYVNVHETTVEHVTWKLVGFS